MGSTERQAGIVWGKVSSKQIAHIPVISKALA